MIPSECQQPFDRLMRHFAWLMEEYGFGVIDSKSGTMGYCGFTLQSGDCLLYMDVERGFLQFGGLALAPGTRELGPRTPGSLWYSVQETIDYLRGWYLSWDQVEERNSRWKDLSEEERMTEVSAECRTWWPRIMALFRHEEFKRNEKALEDFLRNKDEDRRK